MLLAVRSALFLGLLRRPLLSFLLSVPARDVQSAHRPESFRGSPLIEVDSLIDRLDLEKTFGRQAPLHVDLGCGDGSFLCALAQRMPEKNFLGIERLLGRIRSATRKAAKIANVRLLRMESSYAGKDEGNGAGKFQLCDHRSYRCRSSADKI